VVAPAGVSLPEWTGGHAVEQADAASLVAVVNGHLVRGHDVVLVVAPDAVTAAEWALVHEAAADPRVATVSVGSGSAEDDARLRLVPVATGTVVLLCATAAQLVGGLEQGPDVSSIGTVLTDFSLRARERGLFDLAIGPVPTAAPLDEATRPWLMARHPVLLRGLLADADGGGSRPGPSRAAPARVRTGARALRILVDDTTLGPHETGAQITTLAIVRALAEREDVAEVTVALRNGIPPYAREVLGLARARAWIRTDEGYDGAGAHDVVHRTTQPDVGFSVTAARRCAPRVVVTILDLIGYRGGHYFGSTDEWLGYRRSIRDAVAAADAVTTISRDVARIAALEGLAVEPDRLFPILYGTDHLTGAEAGELPRGIVASGHVADDYLLCLGTDYLHKNRDLALAVQRELRARGRRVTLVLAGATVPFGGSSASEPAPMGGADDVVVLPSVSPRERNWLLRHAAVVLYPTSAEGFGLVPFEAARFATPTVHVPFGPFLETLPGELGMPGSWDVAAFAAAVEHLLVDPAARRAQVAAVLEAGARCTWQRTAADYVAMYRALLDRPRNCDV
jgi:hypothetical protein